MSYTPPDEAVPAGQGEAIAAEVPAWAQDYVADTKHDVLMRSLQSYLALNGLILFAAWCYLTLHLTSDTLLLGVLAATALLALAFALMKTHPRASAAALLVVSAAAGLVMPPLLHSPQYLVLVILPVIMAGALFTPAASLACGLLASLAAMRLGGQAFAWPLFAIPALAGVAAWLGFRPLHGILQLSSEQCARATWLSERLRDQRGRLNRTIKDLDASYQLLQQTNRDLILARQEADDLRQLRHRFATNLSHELRTPLNIILGFANLIYLKPSLYGYSSWGEPLLRDLAEIRRAADYLSELVDDVVDLARADAMVMPMQRQPANLRPLIEQAVGLGRSLARGKPVSIVAECGELPEVIIDPVRIQQVLFNLISNAVRFTNAGSITVRAERRDAEVVVSVADTGQGIPAEELVHIFDEFHQVGRPKSDPNLGKGLGLAIARRLVGLHGGRMWAESPGAAPSGEAGPGPGSTFWFTLPLAERPLSAGGQSTAPKPPEARRKPRVLVMDEDGGTTSYLRRRLEAYEFIQVGGEEQLPAVLAAERPLAVVANRSLTTASPDCISPGLLSRLDESTLLVECSLPSTSWIFGQSDLLAVLTKPVSQQEVLAAVRRCLGDQPGPWRILVVDDDRGFAHLVTRILEAELGDRCEVSAAYTGQSALARMRRHKPDMLLLDLLLPDMSGFEVLAELRRDPGLADLPVVAATAATPGEDQLRAEGAAFSIYRRGPFQPGEVIRLLEAALGEAGYVAPGRSAVPPGTLPEQQAS